MRHEILFIEVSSANALWIQEHNTLHSMKMKRHHTSLNDHFDGESSLKRRCLTLRLLMSYIYGAPSKARNANVVYIWTYVWQR